MDDETKRMEMALKQARKDPVIAKMNKRAEEEKAFAESVAGYIEALDKLSNTIPKVGESIQNYSSEYISKEVPKAMGAMDEVLKLIYKESKDNDMPISKRDAQEIERITDKVIQLGKGSGDRDALKASLQTINMRVPPEKIPEKAREEDSGRGRV